MIWPYESLSNLNAFFHICVFLIYYVCSCQLTAACAHSIDIKISSICTYTWMCVRVCVFEGWTVSVHQQMSDHAYVRVHMWVNRKLVHPCVWITEFVCTRGYTVWRPCCHGNQDRASVGGCPRDSSDNLYFLQLCVTPILTPNPWQNEGVVEGCAVYSLENERNMHSYAPFDKSGSSKHPKQPNLC